jgi:hypothetical protein
LKGKKQAMTDAETSNKVRKERGMIDSVEDSAKVERENKSRFSVVNTLVYVIKLFSV